MIYLSSLIGNNIIDMGFFLFVVFILFSLIFIFNKRNQKIKALKHHKIVVVNNTKINQEHLILKNYGTPLQIKESCRVEVIFPDLDKEGNLIYHSSWHHLPELSIPDFKEHHKIKEFRVAKELGFYIKEHLKTERELANLENQYSEVHDLAKLISKSDVYSTQIETYNKALIEIEKLIDKAEQLEKLYINFIKEGLIGIKINNYNPDHIQNNSVIHQTKYKQLIEEYQYMKDTAKAYGELMGQYHK